MCMYPHNSYIIIENYNTHTHNYYFRFKITLVRDVENKKND